MYTLKSFFKHVRKMKTFSDNLKLREFDDSRPALQEILKKKFCSKKKI